MEVAPRARQREILQIGAPALALWNYVFDVKSGALEAFVHQAILGIAHQRAPELRGTVLPERSLRLLA